jgi:hypothetical protein
LKKYEILEPSIKRGWWKRLVLEIDDENTPN